MYNFSGIKLLIVEDDHDLREILGEIFSDLGAEVKLASSGRDGLNAIQAHNFHCVLSDIRMPEGTGIEMARKLLEMPEPKPILFFCSGFNDLSVAEAKKLNVVKIFSKPFNTDELVKTLYEQIQQRWQFAKAG